jgi:hypothetical protein
VFEALHEAVAKASSFVTSAARIGAPISVNSRCASRSSRCRVVSSVTGGTLARQADLRGRLGDDFAVLQELLFEGNGLILD